MRYEEELEGFLNHISLSRTGSDDTRDAYRRDVTHFLEYVEAQEIPSLNDVTRNDISAYVTELRSGKITGTKLSNASYSRHFTADYAAKHTGLAPDRVVEILETCCSLGLCAKSIAHLQTGETFVYESFGDGLLLSIISIAYEKQCGSNSYGYYYGCYNKMIGGGAQ